MNDKHIDIKSIESLPEYRSDSSLIDGHSEKIRELGEKAASRLKDLKAMRQRSEWESDKELDFKSYHLMSPEKQLPYAGYPNIACPLPRIGADTFHANVMFTFGGQNGRFNVMPDFLSRSHMDVAERAAKYMTYVLNYESDAFEALDKADMDAQKYGVGYLETYYAKECEWETRVVETEETVPEINELTGEVTAKKVKRRKKERVKKTKFDGIKVKRIAPECIYASPFFEEIEDAIKSDYLFKVQNYRYAQIEQMSKQGDKDIPPFFSPEAVKKLKDFECSQAISRFEQAKQQWDGNAVEHEVNKQEIQLAECHFMADINGDGLTEKVTLIIEVESGIVLRATFGACRIVKLCPRPVDGRWEGESVRKASQAYITEWEAIHNARVAKGQWANLPFFFYRAGGRFNPQTLTLMPGRGYPVDDPQSVQFPQLPSVDMSYFQEEKLILDYFERTLALGEAIQGVVSGGDTTATESIHAQQKAGIRLATPINRLARALDELTGHIWELQKQCGPEVKEFKVAGVGNGVPVFEKMSNTDYDVMVSFKIYMATLFDVQMLRDTALLNYRTFISNPIVMSNPAAFYELTKNTMKAVGLEINIPKPEQANVRSPFLEHDMILAGQDLEPVLGEDTTEHLTAHDSFMRSEEFQAWPADRQQALAMHVDKTRVQQRLLAAANLNQSGIYEGAGPMNAGGPAMTATRNPSQTFNNMKVGESGKSQQQNVQNGQANA